MGYGVYGDDDYGTDVPVTEEYVEEEGGKGPLAMAYMLVPVLDIANWYQVNDKYGDQSNSDWDNAIMSLAAKAGVNTLLLVSHFAMGGMESTHKMAAALGAVWELANVYLINNASGSLTIADSNTEPVGYGLAGTSAVLSLAGFMAMGGDDGEEEAGGDA